MNYNATQNQVYAEPIPVRRPLREISLKFALGISTGLHVIMPLLVWLVIFVLALLGIHLVLFNPPQPKVRDIEFKIVSAPEQKPLQQTKNRANKDSRAGGKNDPKRPESEPEPKASPPAKAQSQQRPQQKPQPRPQPKQQPKQVVQKQPQPQQPQPQPRPQPKQQPQPKQVVVQPKPQPVTAPRPQPPAPIPPVAYAPQPKAPPNPMAPPVQIANAPKPVGPTGTGNVGPITKSSQSSTSTGSGGPAPVTIGSGSLSSPNSGASGGSTSGSTSGASSKGSSGNSSYGSGNPGNPSAGNRSGAPGINAKKDPDFGPYMAELQRRIKRNWQPPRRNQSKRVILMFTVDRDGRLLNLKINRSSGEPDTDRAAISAVQLSAPFRPLPGEFSGSSIDIQFTFDYNVFGVGGRTF